MKLSCQMESSSKGPVDHASKLRTINLGRDNRRVSRPKREERQNLARKSLTREERNKLKYSQFEPLYNLWLQYAGQMIPEGRTSDDRLVRLDWHGALLMVTEADNPSMIERVGIVVLETRYTMQLITKDDKYIIIPKAGTVFQTAFRGSVLTLFGDAMKYRPSMRGRKTRLRTSLPFSLR